MMGTLWRDSTPHQGNTVMIDRIQTLTIKAAAHDFTMMSFTETLIPSSDSCRLVEYSLFILQSVEAYT